MTSASTAESASADQPDPASTAATAEPTDPKPDRVPELVRRRLATVEDRLDGHSWLATMFVVAIAAIIRFANLSHPPGKIFDEIYYARDAWALIDRAVEWNYKDNGPSYVVHPPLGKWLIGLGEWAFGYSDAEHGISVPGQLWTTAPEFGWRFSAALIGTLAVLLLIRTGRRLFRSTMLGCAAGLLLALDGFHVVLSRTALLDGFLLFFVLAAFATLVLDRDATRRRWARALAAGLDPTARGRAGRPPGGWRNWPWWRLATGVLLGCAFAVKWSALFFVAAFALLMLLWDVGARRSAGVPRPWRATMLDGFPSMVLAGVLMLVTYVTSWSGWLFSQEGYYRLAERYPGAGLSDTPVIGPLWNLVKYHQAALGFHNQLDDAHKYQSWPWQWLLLGRPVAFHWQCEGVCDATSRTEEVLLLGTPLLWWSFLPALVALVWLGLARRDWRAGTLLLFVGAGLLPWFWIALDGRTMFSFYAAPVLPFLVLAVVYVLGAIAAPTGLSGTRPTSGFDEEASRDRRLVGAVIVGAYLVLVVLCFAYFYPIFVGQGLPYAEWSARMWLGGRWI